MSLCIRPVEPRDAALVFSLVRELADYEKLLHTVEADEAAIASALFGEHPRVFCDIAEWDNTPAGFALWFYTYSTFKGRHGIYLEDLFVRPSFRGHGIGLALLAALAERCIREDLGRFEWSVLDWNKPSIAFYEQLGAAHMREWQIFRLTGEPLAELARKKT